MSAPGAAPRPAAPLSGWHVRISLRLGDLDLDVEMEGGSTPVALIGPNGAGKTTLLRTIAGAHHPERGTIRLGERLVYDASRGVDLPPELRQVGYVPQGYGLFPHLSALENVAFGRLAARSDGSEATPGGRTVPQGGDRARRPAAEARRGAALMLMESLECAHLADRTSTGLSGGEQQRIALARALMIEPHILLLDEPLAALDAPARRRLRASLSAHLAARAGPTLVVTHDVRDVAALGAEVYVLERGRVVQSGTSEAVAAAPATDFVAEFFDVGTR